ncbi:MAG: WecB/TagA/CpsF family glycosyltransferase [Firmicutes bacterium]|nr:WecB/TagA/CpsF family glycosyltransferase [Bacillota bacterium]
MKICKILGVPFTVVTPKQAVERIVLSLSANEKSIVYTPNPEMVMEARKDPDFMKVLNSSTMNIPDGIGIVYGSKFTKVPIKHRVAGYDTIQSVFENIKNTEKTVYFFGGAPGIAQKAKEVMEEKYKGLKIVGVQDGYFDEEKEKEIIKDINEKSPSLLLVGIGFPKQEKWIYNNLPDLNVKVAVGVGGSFDVMSGNLKRAPKIFIKLGLEWFHRLITQPSRFVRMLQLPLFMLAVIKNKFTKKEEMS